MRPVTVSRARSLVVKATGDRKAASHTPTTRPAVTSGRKAHALRFLPADMSQVSGKRRRYSCVEARNTARPVLAASTAG